MVYYVYKLGINRPMLAELVPVLAATMGSTFPEIVAKQEEVKQALTQEEELFFKTLTDGKALFDQEMLRRKEILKNAPSEKAAELAVFPGDVAFKLHDTFGFPIGVTSILAEELLFKVDIDGFKRLMAEQKARGKAALKREVITVEGTTEDSLKPTVFYGYDELQSAALIVANENGALAVTETPFYAEMGGQVGDAGEVEIAGRKVPVTNTIKSLSGKVYFHKLAMPVEAKAGERVTLHVDEPRRARIEAHHSGTHLMNWALRKVLGNTITQKGSYVGPDRLRFDFSHGTAVTPEQLREIESLVNEKVTADVPVKWEERPYAEVKGDPSILQFFGDKYGEVVRVVSIGDFSKELCGGTHVRNSGKVGHFKIISEGAIAAGIRRIEAVSGAALVEHVKTHLPKQVELHSALRARKADLDPMSDFLGEETPEAFWKHFEARETFLRQAAMDVAMHEKDEAKGKEAAYQKQAVVEAVDLIGESGKIGNIPVIHHVVDYHPAEYLPFLADAIKKHWQGVLVLASVGEGKVSLLAAVSPDYTKRIQAGKIIQAIAPLVGGKGGGRPELAQGGGTNPQGLPAALEKVEEMVKDC
jgi:alanyl-tRNA synthetase